MRDDQPGRRANNNKDMDTARGRQRKRQAAQECSKQPQIQHSLDQTSGLSVIV